MLIINKLLILLRKRSARQRPQTTTNTTGHDHGVKNFIHNKILYFSFQEAEPRGNLFSCVCEPSGSIKNLNCEAHLSYPKTIDKSSQVPVPTLQNTANPMS